MTTSTYKPFMAYFSQKDIIKLKRFSKQSKTPMAQIIREAVEARLSPGTPYFAGYNAGIKKSIESVSKITAAQMRFPSGKSFAELVAEELEKEFYVEAEHETDGAT